MPNKKYKVGDRVTYRNKDVVVEKVNDNGSLNLRLEDDTIAENIGEGDGANEFMKAEKDR